MKRKKRIFLKNNKWKIDDLKNKIRQYIIGFNKSIIKEMEIDNVRLKQLIKLKNFQKRTFIINIQTFYFYISKILIRLKRSIINSIFI